MQIFLPYTQINQKTDNVVSKKTSSLNINVIKLRNHNIPPPQDPSRRPCLSFSSAAKNLGRGLLEDDGGGGPIP